MRAISGRSSTGRRPSARAPALATLVIAALIIGASWVTAAPAAQASPQAPTPSEPAGSPSPGRRLAKEPPQATVAGFPAAWSDLRIDAMARAWQPLWMAPRPGELGGPTVGLPWRTLVDFYDGRLAFERVFTAAEGLGPTYNDVSCVACHSHPAVGGGGRDMGQGITVHGPPWTGGDAMGLHKRAIPGHAKKQAAGKTARLRTPPLFGLGLLDTVPESARQALEDPQDTNGDGIRGVRASRSGDGVDKPARFGQKSNDWDLRTFLAGAMVDEMGVTNTIRREPRGDADAIADPEAPRHFVLRVDAFVRNLAPPARGPITADVRAGEAVFARLNCVGCHRPQLGPVRGAYTDLLIHDMGPALDSGLKDGVATGAQWRTAPLWGIRHRARYLHDERAPSVAVALAMHQGEAAKPAAAFHALAQADRRLLLAFLGSL